MTRKEMKTLAKQQIKGKIGVLFLIALIISLVSGICSVVPVVGSIASLVITPALTLSTFLVYYKLSKDSAFQPSAGDSFGGFKYFTKAFCVYWAQAIFTFLWTLLFYIPGLIKGIAYSQAMYILIDNPEISGREAIKKSSEMMNGHKMDYFVLQLSFIGWIILGFFTLGILYIWLVPYMNATNANFYQSIKPAETYDFTATEFVATEEIPADNN